MQFHVGPYVYRLVVSDRRIYDEEGEPLEGLCIESRRLLVISPCVEVERREEVALHELCHAHEFAFGAPATAEDRAQFLATVARGFMTDVDAQGGAEAIARLTAVPVADVGQPAARKAVARQSADAIGAPDRRVCGACEAETMCGSITTGEPAQHGPTGQWRVQRWMRCEACGTLSVWTELCTPDGVPTGQYASVPAPRMLRGAEAAAWVERQAAAPQPT